MKSKCKLLLMLSLVAIFVVTMFVGCDKRDGFDYEKYYAMLKEKEDKYDLLNEDAQKGQFVMIGDSIVELFISDYFEPMLEAYIDLKIYNRGIGGDISSNVLKRIDNNVLSIEPYAVFILVGTNDLDLDYSVEAVAENIVKTANKCLEVNVSRVLICSVLPVNQSLSSGISDKRNNRAIKEINSKLAYYCNQNAAAEYVDAFSAITDNDGNFDSNLTFDGLHPNAKGYEAISNEVLKVYNK